MAASGFILTDCFTQRGPCPRSSPRRDHRGHKTARLPSGNAIRLAGGCTCPPETLASEIRTDKPRHRIIARLYNVGVGGILAQHLAKCCPCRPLQARLTALCEPCGTPPVALAGCTLRQESARCTSHGPRLDRRNAPHRGPPLVVCPAPLRRAASGHACDSAAASRLPSATVPRALRFGPAFTGPLVEVTTSSTVAQVPVLARPFAQPRTPPAARPVSSSPCVSLFPRWRGAAPGDQAIQTCTKVSQNPLKSASNHLKSCSSVSFASYCSCGHNIFNQANRQPELGQSNSRWTAKKHQNPNP